MGSIRDHAYATKYSRTASVESSIVDGGIQNPISRLMTSEDFPKCSYMGTLIKDAEFFGTSSLLAQASVGALEPLIGLKLGKRTYFENTGTPSSLNLSTSSRHKSSFQNRIPRCIVEGCSVDLSSAKGYHRKHRVCEYHSKCFKVVISGVERRFCQQCSRFHILSEFDDKKRSCRRRLYDHNARRRKPQLETFHINAAALSSSFYGGKQMSFRLINGSACHSGELGSSVWDHTSSSPKFTITGGYPTKLGRGTRNSSHPEVAPEHFGAYSLLSASHRDSRGVESVPFHCQGMPCAAEPVLHGMHEHLLPFSYGEIPSSWSLPKIQTFRTPYESDFYANTLK